MKTLASVFAATITIMTAIVAVTAASGLTPWQLFQALCPYISPQSPECAMLQQQLQLQQQQLYQQQQQLQQQQQQQQIPSTTVPSTTVPFTSPQVISPAPPPSTTFTPTTPTP